MVIEGEMHREAPRTGRGPRHPASGQGLRSPEPWFPVAVRGVPARPSGPARAIRERKHVRDCARRARPTLRRRRPGGCGGPGFDRAGTPPLRCAGGPRPRANPARRVVAHLRCARGRHARVPGAGAAEALKD